MNKSLMGAPTAVSPKQHPRQNSTKDNSKLKILGRGHHQVRLPRQGGLSYFLLTSSLPVPGIDRILIHLPDRPSPPPPFFAFTRNCLTLYFTRSRGLWTTRFSRLSGLDRSHEGQHSRWSTRAFNLDAPPRRRSEISDKRRHPADARSLIFSPSPKGNNITLQYCGHCCEMKPHLIAPSRPVPSFYPRISRWREEKRNKKNSPGEKLSFSGVVVVEELLHGVEKPPPIALASQHMRVVPAPQQIKSTRERGAGGIKWKRQQRKL